ncbi:uncharacterized protein B0H94_10261 [Salsuginibacillus halophilus]|uniref:DUF177 domain-containing protein n=1 Tax=Salsuginibacillus halophilus TaxID=517424 RepID=A0A2P8HX98_9BACI|nr:YceD family protein [Salsuginibacillus halophilus]PSL50785.1 uncharacterized protein B0H94_10261 [Salsuginibacillus halophilus]
MRWTIQQLLAKQKSGIDVETTVDISEIVERDRELIAITPVDVQGRGEVDRDIASFKLRLQGTMTLPCSRTLAETPYPFDVEMEERFRLDGEPVPDDDVNFHEPENGIVNLTPYIKENVLLALPMQVFADGEEGEAPQTGRDWEVVTQDELVERRSEASEAEEGKVDPRLADLAKYFDK